MVKRVGVLTSGGDCAGLNAVLRAITYRAELAYKCEIIGIRKGPLGLIQRPLDYQFLTIKDFDASNLLRQGGTLLGTTNKTDPFQFSNPDGTYTDHSKDFCNGFHSLNLDALIGIGGDGSMRILRKLAQQGNINLVTIPKTIDNDLGHTETAIGYATAVDVATEALDRLQPTAASHSRVMILEVMGRDAGHIAIAAGIAGGADIILIPEISYELKHLYNKIRSIEKRGRNFALVIVAEAVKDLDGKSVGDKKKDQRMRYGGIGQYLADKITEATTADTRVMTLGHVQRGGQPDAHDRLLASALGIHAVDLVFQGKFDRMVAWNNRKVMDVPISDAIERYQAVESEGALVQTARGLGICLGDS